MTTRRQLLAGGLVALWAGPISLLMGCVNIAFTTWDVVTSHDVEADLQRIVKMIEELGYHYKKIPMPKDDLIGHFSYLANRDIKIEVRAMTAPTRIRLRLVEWFAPRLFLVTRLSPLANQQVTAIDAGLEKEFGRERVLRNSD